MSKRLKFYLRRSGCNDIRYFKDIDEFNEWAIRQLEVQPDTEIIDIVEIFK